MLVPRKVFDRTQAHQGVIVRLTVPPDLAVDLFVVEKAGFAPDFVGPT